MMSNPVYQMLLLSPQSGPIKCMLQKSLHFQLLLKCNFEKRHDGIIPNVEMNTSIWKYFQTDDTII